MQAKLAIGHLHDEDPSEWVMITSITQNGKNKHQTVNSSFIIQPT